MYTRPVTARTPEYLSTDRPRGIGRRLRRVPEPPFGPLCPPTGLGVVVPHGSSTTVIVSAQPLFHLFVGIGNEDVPDAAGELPGQLERQWQRRRVAPLLDAVTVCRDSPCASRSCLSMLSTVQLSRSLRSPWTTAKPNQQCADAHRHQGCPHRENRRRRARPRIPRPRRAPRERCPARRWSRSRRRPRCHRPGPTATGTAARQFPPVRSAAPASSVG